MNRHPNSSPGIRLLGVGALRKYLDQITALVTYLPYGLLAVVILWGGLGSGYMFLLDMPWPESVQLSDFQLQRNPTHTPVAGLLWLASWLVPMWLLQKVVLLSVLVAAGAGAHRLYIELHQLRYTWLAYLSGVIAMCNPFVAERLLAGQWMVLAGYAYSFWLLLLLNKALVDNRRNRLGFLLAGYLATPFVSLHWWYMLTPIVVSCLLFRFRSHIKHRLAGPRNALIAFLALLLLYLVAHGASNSTLQRVQLRDFEAFRTVADSSYGIWLNVLALYGFWSEQFFLPKDFFEHWLLTSLLGFVMVVLGANFALRQQTRNVLGIVLLVFAPFYYVLAIGYAHPITQFITQVFAGFIPGFVGMRETAKFIGVLAVVAALYIPLGVHMITKQRIFTARHTGIALASVVLLLWSMNGMLFGARGQLQAHAYPQGWMSARQFLEAEGAALTAVLPWQGYTHLTFADNAYVANPARWYFTTPVITGGNARNRRLTRAPSLLDQHISAYPAREPQEIANWLYTLKLDFGVSHVLLLKTDSWRLYDKLSTNALLENNDVLVVSTAVDG